MSIEKLRIQIRKLLSYAVEQTVLVRDPWLQQIAAAARRSPSFKALVGRDWIWSAGIGRDLTHGHAGAVPSLTPHKIARR